jgi:hypothetical protein
MLIFEKLGYNKIQSIAIHDIIKEENNNYKEKYEKLMNELHVNKGLIGGGSEKFVFQNHTIIWKINIFDDQIHYSLNTIDKNNECLLIILAKNENNDVCADIHQITMNKNCPVVGHLKKGGSSLLLQIAVEFIKSIKDKYKIKIIQTKDNSEKSCVNKKVKLWLLNTLKTGLPWHINHDFEPYDTEKMTIDELNKIKITANYRILYRTKTSIIKKEKLILMDDLVLSIYNKYENDSILKFFTELLDNPKNCTYIENIQDDLIKKLLLFNITGISYFINLYPNKTNYLL